MKTIVPCASCERRKKKQGYQEPKAFSSPPMGATDIQVYDGSVRRFEDSDWNNDRHKLILFFPEIFTPVCYTEMGALKGWIDKFDKLNVDVFTATTDHISGVQDWYESEELLKDPNYRVLSSYILPTRLGIMDSGRAKRASVFITNQDDVIIQEHFKLVGRSLAELYRTYYAYTTGSFCAEGWQSELDGFLDANGS